MSLSQILYQRNDAITKKKKKVDVCGEKYGEGCEKERKRMKRKKRIEENAEQIRERIAKKVMQEARECQRDMLKKDGSW